MFFKTRLETAQDGDGLLDCRLSNVDLLETTRQRCVFFEDPAIFRERGRADALQLTRRQRRLQQIRCIQRTARSRTRANQRVNFVDEQHRMRAFLQLFQHRLEALLEIATVFSTGQQCAHIERIHLGVRENVRHFAARDAPGKPFGNGGLTHASLTDQERIVLPATAQHLHHTLDFQFTANQRIDLAVFRELVQVLRELRKRRFLLRSRVFRFGIRVAAGLRGVTRIRLRNAMRDEIDDVEARYSLLLQVIDGM